MFRLISSSKPIILLLFAIPVLGQGTVDSAISAIQLKTYVEQDAVPLNREVVYQVELSWEGPLNQFEIGNISEPVVTNLRLRSSGSANKFYQDAEGDPHSVRRITYYFTPLEIGMGYIDGVIINYQDKMLGQESSLMAQRLGVKITEPVHEGGSAVLNVTFFLWIFTIAFLGVIGFFVYRYVQRRKKEQEEADLLPRTVEEKYLNLLHETIHPKSGASRDRLGELERLLNSYISEKRKMTGMPGMQDVITYLKDAHLEEELLSKITRFYEQSERTRFAGEAFSQSDFHLYYDTVELVLKQFNAKNQQQDADVQT